VNDKMTRKEDLGYYWKAEFDDDSTIEQFDKNENETLFKDVLDKEDSLIRFSVISNDNKESYTADLSAKTLTGPGVSYSITGKAPKLTYFRRNSVRMEVGGQNRKLLSPNVVHMLGIKTSTNEKRLEIFAGQGMKPKEISYHDVKTAERVGITKTIEKEVNLKAVKLVK